MSLLNHTLIHNGFTRTLADWGLIAGTTDHQLFAGDTIELTAKERIDSATDFAPLKAFTLKDPAGNVVMSGVFTGPKLKASGQIESRTIIGEGPWYWLARAAYTQAWIFAIDPTAYDSAAGGQQTGKVALGNGTAHDTGLTGITQLSASTVKQELKRVLDFCIAAGGVFAYDLPADGDGDTFPKVAMPEDHFQGAKCGDVVRRIMQQVPFIGCRWDYTTTPPTLRFFSILRPGHSLSALPTTPFDVQTLAVGDVDTFDGWARHDLLVHEVIVIRLGSQISTSLPSLPITVSHMWSTIVTFSSVLDNGAFGTEVLTFQQSSPVSAGIFQSMELGPFNDDSGLNPAQVLHSTYAELLYELQWSVLDDEVDWSILPGVLYNATGADTDCTAANSPVQSVRRDIARGMTSVRCGVPLQIGLGRGRHDLRRLAKQTMPQKPDDKSEQTYGFKDHKDASSKEGTAWQPCWLYRAPDDSHPYGQLIEAEALVKLSDGGGGVTVHDLALARAFRDSSGTLVAGNFASFKFKDD